MRFVLPLLLAAILGLAAGVGSAFWMGGLLPFGPRL